MTKSRESGLGWLAKLRKRIANSLATRLVIIVRVEPRAVQAEAWQPVLLVSESEYGLL
jgi:hypothetical protein